MKLQFFKAVLFAFALLISVSAEAMVKPSKDGVIYGPDDRPIGSKPIIKDDPKCLEAVANLKQADANLVTQIKEFSAVVKGSASRAGNVEAFRYFKTNELSPKSSKYLAALRDYAVYMDRVGRLKCNIPLGRVN